MYVYMLTGAGGVEAAPTGDPLLGIATLSATVSSYTVLCRISFSAVYPLMQLHCNLEV